MVKNIKNINLNGTNVGGNNPPYIVAELSGNHNGSFERAIKIIREAKECGADAVKIQTYTPDTITINHKSSEFLIKEGLWKNKFLYDLYKEAYTPWEWHKELFEYAKSINLTLFSSPFDKSAVELLENLGNPFYKIASPELIDLELIKEVAATKKPIIFSTGMGSLLEIEEAIKTARDQGSDNIIVLHCTSSYPAPIKEANLSTIREIKKRFDVISGLSDHTEGILISTLATVMGASLIEKHFTLDRSEGGVDSDFSIEPNELKMLVKETKNAYLSIGSPAFSPTQSEEKLIKCRRSIYVVKPIKKGEFITKENVRSIRPGNGLLPKYINFIIGKKASKDINYGEAFKIDMIENNQEIKNMISQ